MSSIAETLVEEWLNRLGYFTIRGIRLGVQEIDLLAVSFTSGKAHCRHVEVQASMRPVTYISQVPTAVRKATGRAANSAEKRTPDELRQGVAEWVDKKFRHDLKDRVRQRLVPGSWEFELIVNVVRHPEELQIIEEQGIRVRNLTDIVSELKHSSSAIPGASGSDLVDLILARPLEHDSFADTKRVVSEAHEDETRKDSAYIPPNQELPALRCDSIGDLLSTAPPFSFAHEAACYILGKTNGQCSDDELNSFVLHWGQVTGKPLKDTPQQNKCRVVKYRKSWAKHGHCRDMYA